jgi:hypothetical protein
MESNVPMPPPPAESKKINARGGVELATVLSFDSAGCSEMDPIERLWGLMHKHVTHNRCHATFADFKVAILTFLREEVPRQLLRSCRGQSSWRPAEFKNSEPKSER